MANFEQWAGFKGRKWTHSVDVRDFIQENYTPYEGDEAFLEGPTEATEVTKNGQISDNKKRREILIK